MTQTLSQSISRKYDISPLTWRTYLPDQAHEALARWRQIERRLHSGAVTCSAAWTECWIQHYGDIVPYRILAAEAAGETRGICLLTSGVGHKAGPFPLRTRHLGTSGERTDGSVCVEYNRLLVEEEYREALIAGVVEAFHTHPPWDEIRLDGFAEADLQPWLRHFPGARLHVRDSKFFNFRGARTSGEDILQRLGKNTRSNIRRLIKKYGELTGEWAESIEQGTEIFEELVHLHQQRWNAVGEPGAFANQRFLNFQRELVVRLMMENRTVLFRLRQGEQTIGCLLLLIDENRLLDYLSGFISFEDRPSPGLITHYVCMEAALSRGFDAYDFLVGDKRHKENLSTDVNRLCWLTWARPSFKNRTIRLLRHVRDTLRRSPTPSSDVSRKLAPS